MAALPLRAALAALATGNATQLPDNPDAELVQACRDHVAAYLACEKHGDHERASTCEFYRRVDATEAKALAMPARTWAGVRAKAEVARFFAARNSDWSESFTGDWPAAVCKDVIRLASETDPGAGQA
jgi:hypothetical protein